MCIHRNSDAFCQTSIAVYLSKIIVAWLLRHFQNRSSSKQQNEQRSPMNLSQTLSFTKSKEVLVLALIPALKYDIHIYIYICMYVHVSLSLSIYIYLYIHAYIYVYMYIHIHILMCMCFIHTFNMYTYWFIGTRRLRRQTCQRGMVYHSMS